MEDMLGCWLCLLLPVSMDPICNKLATELYNVISGKGVPVTKEMIKVLIYFLLQTLYRQHLKTLWL